ncbi:MAG: LPS export ABC transporter periplasmic protein LptC [Nitrospinae bacterium]|nr:LPS export ABC transporter periplasmic protein LptC [Nitrospinota bacterium]
MGFQRIKKLLIGIFCLSLVLTVATFLKRSHLPIPSLPPKVISSLLKADLAIQSIHLVENLVGHTEWELYAESGETFQDEKLTVLKDVRAKFYPEGHPVIHVSGKEGRFEMDTRNMTIRGDVLVRSEAGYTLKTERLHYDAARRQVETDLPIELVQEGLVVKGVGLSASIDGKTLTVHSDVEAVFQ